jgi:outer membrane protein assembly factor BamB
MAPPQFSRTSAVGRAIAVTAVALLATAVFAAPSADTREPQMPGGIRAVLGLPAADRPDSVVAIAQADPWLTYFQSPDEQIVAAVREAAEQAGVLGKRLFVEQGPLESVHLADNLVDELLIFGNAVDSVPRAELLRVLRPGGTASLGTELLVKPRPAGVDAWSHPYHGPDNNPQSTDQLARAPYQTQFLAEPFFSPMPEVTVAAHGRIFKAFGHIAHKANQNAVLNTLMGINAYNGTLLWRRDLREGFMIHRNTMIATPDALYLGDDQSCMIIDAATGEVRDEIVVPEGIADGTVWKWMALQNGVLYALVGGTEVHADTQPSNVGGLGHWPWGMWKGHDYGDPRTNFGFGRTFLALDAKTKEILWTYRDEDYIDSRGVCMGHERIYFYSPERFLGCLDTRDGSLAWKNADENLLQAIGPNESAQHYVTGYSTTTYIKCSADQLFFAGPQRQRFVVASTEDGRLLWQKRHGNLQLVLREDGVYCVGPQHGEDMGGAKYSYDGRQLASLPARRACTRATGSVDSVFYRASGGTVRIDVESDRAEHIAPMRPPCQDGVIISDGLLFWGPWMCGCQLSLYGHVALSSAPSAGPATPTGEPQLRRGDGALDQVAAHPADRNDWPAFQRDSWRSSYTPVPLPDSVQLQWTYPIPLDELPTAPIIVGGTTFVADRAGVVRAIDPHGALRWATRTGGPIYYPPTFANGRLFVGSADGRVYALEATSGRQLWSYRVAPDSRWIPVFGKLISTWPVAAGVAVEDNVVYAAAGITHYDGTYVVALDAVTGEPLWENHTSGTLAEDVNSGISLQGELQIRGDELQFLGGGVYLFARFDRRTGQCLNEPQSVISSQFQTVFYPYFPVYGRYVSLHHTFPDGRSLTYASSVDGSHPTPLSFLEPADQAAPKRRGKQAGDGPAPPAERKPVWQTPGPELYTGFVLTPRALLAGSPTRTEYQAESPSLLRRVSQRLWHVSDDSNPDEPRGRLLAINLDDGTHQWEQPLSAPPVKGGIALDHQRRIVVSLENGRIQCFSP